METFMPLLLLTLCAHARGEPLPTALQRRSDSHGVYARDFAQGYKPYPYAPVQMPVSVMHFLSGYPMRRPPISSYLRASASENVPVYEHPYTPYNYATSMSNLYQVSYVDSEEEPTILYARPNPKGGYLYRRRPTKAKPRRPAPAPEPIIIRVHKYRIVRDR